MAHQMSKIIPVPVLKVLHHLHELAQKLIRHQDLFQFSPLVKVYRQLSLPIPNVSRQTASLGTKQDLCGIRMPRPHSDMQWSVPVAIHNARIQEAGR